MNNETALKLTSVGVIHNNRTDAIDDNWNGVISTIKLSDKVYEPSATDGLNEFSHLEVIFYMNRVSQQKIVTGSRHPRNNINLPKVGILAQRGKNRPNQLGVSFAKVIEVNGLTLTVSGLDAIDGTPVLDIKPCINYFLPQESIIQPDWVDNIMKNYF